MLCFQERMEEGTKQASSRPDISVEEPAVVSHTKSGTEAAAPSAVDPKGEVGVRTEAMGDVVSDAQEKT